MGGCASVSANDGDNVDKDKEREAEGNRLGLKKLNVLIPGSNNTHTFDGMPLKPSRTASNAPQLDMKIGVASPEDYDPL